MNSFILPDGKEYISSKHASHLSKYTSDYIGQLAREGKIPSIKKGKERFVLKKEFLEYARDQRKLLPGVYAVLEERELSSKALESLPTLSYEEDDSDLIPLPNREVSIPQSAPLPALTSNTKSQTAGTEVNVSPEHEKPFGWMYPVVACFLVVLCFTIFSSPARGENQTETFYPAAISLAEDAQSFMREALSLLGSAFLSLGFIAQRTAEHTGAEKTLSEVAREVKKDWEERDAFSASVMSSPVHSELKESLVVFPSSEFETDEERVKKIKESFSDDVEVIEGEDGKNGYIVPAFEGAEDERYRYVIVPE